jgi:hypothetical protein
MMMIIIKTIKYPIPNTLVLSVKLVSNAIIDVFGHFFLKFLNKQTRTIDNVKTQN